MFNRRQFNQGLMAGALGGLATHLKAAKIADALTLPKPKAQPEYLVADPNEMLDLPPGFSYQTLSKLGDMMNDTLLVPDRADGMGCFALDTERVVLVRNHELPAEHHMQPHTANISSALVAKAYDTNTLGRPLLGGTSTIVYNLKTHQVEYQCMSLLGTIRNCSGGITPWGSWLSCEESVAKASNTLHKDHGYVFEVPSQTRALVEPTPLKAMGRFNHEAACVDPQTGIVYLTEDRSDSLFYRFIPNVLGELSAGGKLQGLMIIDQPKFDSRNWQQTQMQAQREYACQWLDLDNVDSQNDDLRIRGFKQGAALFARGEGIYFGEKELYFCCTNGGNQQLGQIMRYTPTPLKNHQQNTSQTGTINLFLESPNKATFNYGDNITVTPNGHLLVCEDQYTEIVNNHLKGITQHGDVYNFAKVRWQTEPAGACFSPDGSVLFLNLYSPTVTLAITGPWETLYANY